MKKKPEHRTFPSSLNTHIPHYKAMLPHIHALWILYFLPSPSSSFHLISHLKNVSSVSSPALPWMLLSHFPANALIKECYASNSLLCQATPKLPDYPKELVNKIDHEFNLNALPWTEGTYTLGMHSSIYEHIPNIQHNAKIRLNNSQNEGKGTGKFKVISGSQDCVGRHVQIWERSL